MTTLKLSPEFQVVIPNHIREAMKLKAGLPMQVVHGAVRGPYRGQPCEADEVGARVARRDGHFVRAGDRAVDVGCVFRTNVTTRFGNVTAEISAS